MQFGFGSLVAAPNFDGDFLFVIGEEGACKYPQGSCNLDINFPSLFLDGAKVASGMQINNVMGVTIGPGGYFLNFTQYGLQINAGHEVMMDRCWLGETNFDYDHEQHGTKPNATAIQINGNDHYILNTIVFSALTGLEVNGAADYVTGVHVWFPVNHAVAFPDSYAFHITGAGNRFMGCCTPRRPPPSALSAGLNGRCLPGRYRRRAGGVRGEGPLAQHLAAGLRVLPAGAAGARHQRLRNLPARQQRRPR